MKVLPPERLELIDALVADSTWSGITAGLLEKDEHLTDALRTLFALRLDGMVLVFCGGTSLSKAHGLIERMSEDVDLKIVLLPSTRVLSGAALRKRLSSLKSTIAGALSEIGLVEDAGKARALNENRYFCSEWSYALQYASVASLRPRLLIEMTVRSPVLAATNYEIGSLTERLAGRKERLFSVPVVSIAETVAEKVLSFLRRYAQHRAGLAQQARDTALVRHVYDVHCACLRDPAVVDESMTAFAQLVPSIRRNMALSSPISAQRLCRC